jgi:hypothetical protein
MASQYRALATAREKVSPMETAVIDFVPWGLDATWPSQRWLELVDGRRDSPPRGARLGHASESAMVLVCTYPRSRFDAEMPGTGADLVRELAFESTFALINFALHQIKGAGQRPDGLVGSLVSYANQQADQYPDWGTAYWGIGQGGHPGPAGHVGQASQASQPGFGFSPQPASGLRGGLRLEMAEARTTALAGWQSGFSTGDPDSYIVVHACGVGLDHLQLTQVSDPASYGLTAGPPVLGEMHWELWPSQQDLRYDDLARLVAG